MKAVSGFFRIPLFLCLQNQICLAGNIQFPEVLVFHGDPLRKESFMQKGWALQHPLPLQLRVNGQQDLQIIGITEIRMQRVRTLNDGEPLGSNLYRLR